MLPATLASLVIGALKIGVVCDDDGVAGRALAELDELGVSGSRCAASAACLGDPRCSARVLSRCSVDGLLYLDWRDETWIYSVVVDGAGAAAVSLDEARASTVLAPPVRARIASLSPRDPSKAPPPGPAEEEALVEDREPRRKNDDAVFIGAGAAALGLVVAVAAGGVASAAELTLLSAESSGDEKLSAQGTARAAWMAAATGVLLGGVGALVVATSWPFEEDEGSAGAQ